MISQSKKKPTSLNHKEQPEPIYAKVDLSKKRSERQAKHIKDNSGTYHGLVQDKVNNLQVKLNEQSANKPASHQIKTKAGFNVKEIRQNFEHSNEPTNCWLYQKETPLFIYKILV